MEYYGTHRTVESHYQKFVSPPLPQTATTAPTHCMFTILILNSNLCLGKDACYYIDINAYIMTDMI